MKGDPIVRGVFAFPHRLVGEVFDVVVDPPPSPLSKSVRRKDRLLRILLREISTRSLSTIGQLAGISEEQEEALLSVVRVRLSLSKLVLHWSSPPLLAPCI